MPPVVVSSTSPDLQNKLERSYFSDRSSPNRNTRSLRNNRTQSPSNAYWEETNARLNKQLLEMKADEQDLAQKNKELSLENRRLKMIKKIEISKTKVSILKLVTLNLAKSTLERKSDNLNIENKSLSTENRKLLNLNDKLKAENTNLGQKLAKSKSIKKQSKSQIK